MTDADPRCATFRDALVLAAALTDHVSQRSGDRQRSDTRASCSGADACSRDRNGLPPPRHCEHVLQAPCYESSANRPLLRSYSCLLSSSNSEACVVGSQFSTTHRPSLPSNSKVPTATRSSTCPSPSPSSSYRTTRAPSDSSTPHASRSRLVPG